MYSIEASAQVANSTLTTSAGFTVEADLREYDVTRRDTALLQHIARSSQGVYYGKEKIDHLVADVIDELAALNKNQVIRSTQPRVNEIFWLCLALLLFGAEWVLRKYAGSF